MSEIAAPRRRRRRSDADRSVGAILVAAKAALAADPNASVEDIAKAAGVSRQTVYAHFRTREALVGAVVDTITAEAVADMDAAHLDDGPAGEALLRLLDVSWRTLQRYPRLLAHAAASSDPATDAAGDAADDLRHRAVFDHLERVLTRGQQADEFADDLDTGWLATAVITLGHAAGNAVSTGQMSLADATTALARSVLRVCGVTDDVIAKLVDAAT